MSQNLDEPIPFVLTFQALAKVAPDAPLPIEVVPQETEPTEAD